MNINKVKKYVADNVYESIKSMLQCNEDLPQDFENWVAQLKKEEVDFVAGMEFPVYASMWNSSHPSGEIPQEQVDVYYDEILQTILDNWYI